MARPRGFLDPTYAAVAEVRFQGRIYRRYPYAERRTDRVYFKATGNRYLHVDVFRAFNGPVPAGHQVHHADGDTLNNDPSNLAAEPKHDHLAFHGQQGAAVGMASGLLDRIRPLTVAWHRSVEGRDWHRQHGQEAFKKRVPLEKACDQCGKSFKTMGRRESDRFCSNNCKAAWRRASGVDDEDRTCAVCGGAFRCNRYSKKACCSRACGVILSSRKRRRAST